MADLGFIGTGTIGGPMAARLLAHDHALAVFDREPQALQPLLAQGARAADSIAILARDCTTVCLSLPGPTEIASVVLDADGLLANAGALTTIVDLSTNSVALARDLAKRARAQGVHYLDAPVSGGKVAARDGKLAIMVGGDAGAYAQVRPLLACLGEHLFHLGESGSGTLAKLVNNQIFLCASVLIQEGFVLGAKAGMDTWGLLEVLKASSAGPLLARAPLLLSHRYDRGLFALGIAAKDVALALESAAALDLSLPLTAAASEIYQAAVAQGLGQADFFATLAVLEERAGTTVPPLVERGPV